MQLKSLLRLEFYLLRIKSLAVQRRLKENTSIWQSRLQVQKVSRTFWEYGISLHKLLGNWLSLSALCLLSRRLSLLTLRDSYKWGVRAREIRVTGEPNTSIQHFKVVCTLPPTFMQVQMWQMIETKLMVQHHFYFHTLKKEICFSCYHFVVNSRKCDPSSNGPILADGTEQGWGAWRCNAILARIHMKKMKGWKILDNWHRKLNFFENLERQNGQLSMQQMFKKCRTTQTISILHSKSWTCKNDARYHGNIAEATWRTADIESHGPWGGKLWWTYQVLNVSLWDDLNPLK